MSVITDAIHNKLASDPILSGTYDEKGNAVGDGLLDTYQYIYWDHEQDRKNRRIIPAIYTFHNLKTFADDVDNYIITAGNVSDIPSVIASSKTRRARDITRDIICFHKEDLLDETNDFDYRRVEEIAERVYEIFHRQSLNIPIQQKEYTPPATPSHYSQWETVLVNCNGPMILEPEQAEQFDRKLNIMVVTINFTVQEVV